MKETREGLLSVREAADFLGLSVWTLYSWVSQGKITRTKLGRRTMFRREDLNRLIQENTGINGKHSPQAQGA